MDENKFWLSIIVSIITGIVLIIISSQVYSYNLNRKAMDSNYEKATITGYSYPVLQKIKQN